MINMFIRLILTVPAIVLIFMGLIVLPLPIPFGSLLIFVGFAILISSNAAVAQRLKQQRRRFVHLNAMVCNLERRLPGKLGDVVRRTTP